MTATLTAPTTAATPPRPATEARPSLVRLAAIELRKMADTRAGLWLLIATALISVAMVVIVLFTAEPQDQTFRNMFQATLFPTAVLLPVLGILSVTSEWTQRTALTTFALVPVRHRVATAKLLASVALGVVSIVPGLVMAAIGNVLAGSVIDGASASWDFPAITLGYSLIFAVANILFGLGFGMLFMNSAVAIVLYFVVPTVWSILTASIAALDKVASWLDLTRTSEPLFQTTAMSGESWGRLAASLGVWVLLPGLLGLWRLLKREVS